MFLRRPIAAPSGKCCGVLPSDLAPQKQLYSRLANGDEIGHGYSTEFLRRQCLNIPYSQGPCSIPSSIGTFTFRFAFYHKGCTTIKQAWCVQTCGLLIIFRCPRPPFLHLSVEACPPRRCPVASEMAWRTWVVLSGRVVHRPWWPSPTHRPAIRSCAPPTRTTLSLTASDLAELARRPVIWWSPHAPHPPPPLPVHTARSGRVAQQPATTASDQAAPARHPSSPLCTGWLVGSATFSGVWRALKLPSGANNLVQQV